jgi:hypothetical protein
MHGQSSPSFRVLLNALPVAAYACDSEGMITAFNERARELWGRAPRLHSAHDRYCGAFRLRAADGSPMPHDACWMARALREGRAFNGKDVVVEQPDGALRDVAAYANPILDEHGHVIGGVNILVDVTERRSAETEFRRTLGRANTALEAQRAQLTDLAHVIEARATPVTTPSSDLHIVDTIADRFSILAEILDEIAARDALIGLAIRELKNARAQADEANASKASAA